MLYAPFNLFGFAVVGGFGAGQIDSVHRTPATAAQEAGKAQADKLRGAGVIRYWLDAA